MYFIALNTTNVYYMNGIYLIIGGNMGNRAEHLATCRKCISEQIGMITQASSIYETAAWGNQDNPAFLNQVICIQTSVSPIQLLEKCLAIEAYMGRKRTTQWASRIIDIDILFYKHLIIQLPQLQIPHPHIPQRRFVLTPMNEIAPLALHPVLQKSMRDLLINCPDQLACAPFIEA